MKLGYCSLGVVKPAHPSKAACGLVAAAILLTGAFAAGQGTSGTPGSPSATTTISGKQLPPPDPKFGGDIKESAQQSKAWWPPRVVPPKGAPNCF
jgi:arylsulfatase